MRDPTFTDTSHYAKCREHIAAYKRRHMIRFGLLTALLVFGIWQHLYALEVAGTLGAILVSILCAALALFADQRHLRVYICLLIYIVIGYFLGAFEDILTLLMLLIYLSAIPEIRNMRWVVQQPGYPHFSERLDAQQAAEYVPMYTNSIQDATTPESVEMPEIPDFPDDYHL